MSVFYRCYVGISKSNHHASLSLDSTVEEEEHGEGGVMSLFNKLLFMHVEDFWRKLHHWRKEK